MCICVAEWWRTGEVHLSDLSEGVQLRERCQVPHQQDTLTGGSDLVLMSQVILKQAHSACNLVFRDYIHLVIGVHMQEKKMLMLCKEVINLWGNVHIDLVGTSDQSCCCVCLICRSFFQHINIYSHLIISYFLNMNFTIKDHTIN